ncbi:hypothetical protein AtubIFM55763_004284 [Aspergillus tubingensis]|nr:hypothetical protein AtubIFM55763_004284 [Aspergillus tubingensis]
MGGFALRCTPDPEEGEPSSKNEKATTKDQDDDQSSTSPPLEDETALMGGPSMLKPMTSASCCGKPEKQIQSTLTGNPAKKFEEVFYLSAIEALKLLCSTEASIPGLENVSEEEINARSKSDMFMRLLAVGQIVWVVIQIISRWAYGLAVTQLEVTVVAFAFCAVGMYFVNHGKPKGVELPILFEYPGSKEALVKILGESAFPDPQEKHNKWKFYRCKYCNKEKTQSHGGTRNANKKSSDGNDKNHEPANNNDSTDAKSEAMPRRDPEANADVEESEVVPKGATMTMIWTSSLDTFTAIVQGVRETLKSSRGPGDPIGNGFIDEAEDPSKLSNVLTDLWMFIGTMKSDNSSTPEDTKPDDPAGLGESVSSTGPDQVQANPNTELDTRSSPGPEKNPSWEAENAAPPPEDSKRDIESQKSPPQRWETLEILRDLVIFVLGSFYILLWFILLILLGALAVVGALAYVVARLFIVVEMFRTLAFLPPDAYIATWSSELPNIG